MGSAALLVTSWVLLAGAPAASASAPPPPRPLLALADQAQEPPADAPPADAPPADAPPADAPPADAPPADAPPTDAPSTENEEELVAPDEELAPDDLLFDDEPSSSGGEEAPPANDPNASPGSSGDASAGAPGGINADDLEADALGLAPEEPAAEEAPAVTVAPEQGRTAEQVTTAMTIGLVGCGALAAVGAIIGIVANPLMATWVVFNVFAPLIAVPLFGGTLAISETLAAAGLWAVCVATPVPTVASLGAGVAGTAGQAAMDDPWLPLGAAAVAAVPGVVLALASGAVVLGGVGYGLSLEHLDVERLQAGETEVVYLTLSRAITGSVVALVGALLGVIAAPVAGGGAVGAAYLVAQWEGVLDEEAEPGTEVSLGRLPGAGRGQGVEF